MRFIVCAALALIPIACSPESNDGGASENSSGGAPGVADPGARHPVREYFSFARTDATSFAAFHLETGEPYAERRLSGPILDLDWDEVSSRLLVVEASPEVDESVILAFRYRDGAFELDSSSPRFSPESRVIALFGQTLALSEDMGVSWSLLDGDLQPVRPSKAIARPAGFRRIPGEVMALDPHGLDEQGGDSDVLLGVKCAGAWEVGSFSVPAPGRPASRLAWDSESDRTFLVQQSGSAFDVVELSSTRPIGSFRREIEDASGELVEVVIDGDTLIALLSRDGHPERS